MASMSDLTTLPLVVPSALADEQKRIAEDFRAEGIDVTILGLYATKAAGPLPDANFWIDLTRHAESFPFEHFLDQLEGGLGTALLMSFGRVAKWAQKNIRIHLRLPTKRQATQYIIPEAPNDKAAVKAIPKHYKTARENPANEYFWINGTWVSADEYFAAKRG